MCGRSPKQCLNGEWLHILVKKKKENLINHLRFYPRRTEIMQIKSKKSGGKAIVKINVEISETKKIVNQLRKSIKPRCGFLKNSINSINL